MDWFFEQLNGQLATFNDDTCELLSSQKIAFDSYCAILRETTDSLKKRSKQRRSTLNRTRNLLKDIYHSIGCEVFLLCTIAVPISRLGENALKILLPDTRGWWKSRSCPLGLTTVATALCHVDSIGTFILPSGSLQAVSEGRLTSRTRSPEDQEVPSRPQPQDEIIQGNKKRHYQDISSCQEILHDEVLPGAEHHGKQRRIVGGGSWQDPDRSNADGKPAAYKVSLQNVNIYHSVPDVHRENVPPTGILEISHPKDQILDQRAPLKEAVVSSHIQDGPSTFATTNAPIRPANHEEVLHFKLSQLISFLQQYENSHPNLRMVCPWGGVPLPSVELSLEPSVGLYVKVEFSLKSSEAIMQFVS